MPITFKCHCGKTLRVPDKHAGRRAMCPACRAITVAPTPHIPAEQPEPLFEIVEIPKLAAPAVPITARPTHQKPRDDEDDTTPYGLATSSDDDDDANAPEEQAESATGTAAPKKKKIRAPRRGLPNFRIGTENHS